MTSVHALPDLASKIFYFSLVASVFAFISMLLLTTLHPWRPAAKATELQTERADVRPLVVIARQQTNWTSYV